MYASIYLRVCIYVYAHIISSSYNRGTENCRLKAEELTMYIKHLQQGKIHALFFLLKDLN